MGTIVNIEEENRRRRRINKIKKIIICLVIVAIIVPVTISGMLAVKVVMLEKELANLRAATAKTLVATNEQTGEPKVIGEQTDMTDDSVNPDDTDTGALPDDTEQITENDTPDGLKKVYLTFDDGPSDNTDEILDILKEYNVKATFFVVAKNDKASLDRYNRIVREGHTLAMHSYTHIYNQIYGDIEAYKNDVISLQNYLYDITGVRPSIYRFPGGSSNTVMNINVQDCIDFLDEQGITYFDWNVASGDATGNGYPASVIAENIMTGVAKHQDSVVLMHDASDKDATVAALPIVLENFLEMDDIILLPITEDSVPIQHTKKN
ncbi:MAG: polysaccharide deacetylase family protein [Lachnospiraceae bacterium]